MGKEVEGVANGLSKTMCHAKFSSNFTGLAVVFFSGYVHFTVSIFCKARKVTNYRCVFFFCFLYINNLRTS